MMNYGQFTAIEQFFQANPAIFFLILAWSLYWKGMALWKAARQDDQKWFIALLIVNLFGILEILYLYVFSKRTKKNLPPQA